MLVVTTTPEDVAVDLGLDPAELDSVRRAQLQRWIDDAARLINQRIGDINPDPGDLDYVIRQAVVAVAQAPTPGLDSESVQIDDGMLTQRFSRTPRRVAILPEWWDMLGVTTGKGKAFSVDMTAEGYGWSHQPWCDLALGGATCSCGAWLAGYPIYED